MFIQGNTVLRKQHTILKVDVNANYFKVFDVQRSCLYQYLDIHMPFQVNLTYEIFGTVKFIQVGSYLLIFTKLAFFYKQFTVL